TPLASIQLSLGLLKAGVYDNKPSKFKRMLEIALIDTQRLVSLVNDILDLERLEAGRAILEKGYCQAADLMQQAASGLQTIASQNQVTLSIEATDVELYASAEAIVQTLTNLLSNAIKFSPPHSTVSLQVEERDRDILFTVRDHGRGIPADKLKTIFGRFQQVDASDAREKGGTGLGLAICQSIVEQHSGQIWVESTLGEGSTFFVSLPRPAAM
ncbi:MAG TPA: HAMP domain-containing sensor histidine kinase, partial [Chroococcidiopsis sp.]